MPTIKTQVTGGVRRIITKLLSSQRRISCSCCETSCCMYPAQYFGSGYIDDDLPEELESVDGSGVVEFIFTKIDPSSSYWGGYYQGNYNDRVWEILLEDNEWVVAVAETPNPEDGFIGTGSGPCLISDQFAQIGGIFDLFEDTYTVNTYDESISGPPESTFTITRQSLCVWTGFDSRYGNGANVSLVYSINESGTREGMWSIEGFGRVDGGPYNSPVGSYVDGNYIWDVVE